MKKGKTEVYFYFIVGVLLVSFAVNVYMGILEGSYKKRVFNKSYISIHDISSKNINVNKSLQVVTRENKIKKTELIKLKQLYDGIYDKSLCLVDDFMFYNDENISGTENQDSTQLLNVLAIYEKIRPYLTELLEENMCNTEEYIYINDMNNVYFKVLYQISNETNEYFEKLVKEQTKSGTFDELKIRLQNKVLLEKVLKDISKINSKQNGVDFSLKEIKNQSLEEKD